MNLRKLGAGKITESLIIGIANMKEKAIIIAIIKLLSKYLEIEIRKLRFHRLSED